MSQPTQIPEGWAVVICEGIEPGRKREFAEMSESVGQRIRAARKDAALSALLGKWREEFKVVVDTKVLAEMPSLAELAKPAQDLTPVVEKSLDGDA
jgi:hypothetical protein